MMTKRSYLFLVSYGGRVSLLAAKEQKLSTNSKLLPQRELLPDNRRNWAWNQGKLVIRRREKEPSLQFQKAAE